MKHITISVSDTICIIYCMLLIVHPNGFGWSEGADGYVIDLDSYIE